MQIILFFFTKVYRYLFLKVLMLRILFVVLKLHIVLLFLIKSLFQMKTVHSWILFIERNAEKCHFQMLQAA